MLHWYKGSVIDVNQNSNELKKKDSTESLENRFKKKNKFSLAKICFILSVFLIFIMYVHMEYIYKVPENSGLFDFDGVDIIASYFLLIGIVWIVYVVIKNIESYKNSTPDQIAKEKYKFKLSILIIIILTVIILMLYHF